MNPRKSHISSTLSMGLAALLVMGCLIASIGVSFARYRTAEKDGIGFRPARAVQVYLGCMDGDGFQHRQSSWVTTESTHDLSFAVSNGEVESSYAWADQEVSVRLIASLGAWQNDHTGTMYLRVQGQVYTAVAERIAEGTMLHGQFGDGWILRFVDPAGNEPTWSLPGGCFSCIEMQLSCNGTAIADTSLLQLQVIGTTR